VIGIDSMVLVYAGVVPRKSSETSTTLNELSLRAKMLLHMKKDDTIVLPMVAVSEVLVPLPSAQKGLFAAKLSGKFLLAPFDMRAAVIAADLWVQHKSLPTDLRYKRRSVLKSDAMIIATAKAAGATEFYTHDRRCRVLADLIMSAHDLPTHAPDLFLRGEIERGEV